MRQLLTNTWWNPQKYLWERRNVQFYRPQEFSSLRPVPQNKRGLLLQLQSNSCSRFLFEIKESFRSADQVWGILLVKEENQGCMLGNTVFYTCWERERAQRTKPREKNKTSPRNLSPRKQKGNKPTPTQITQRLQKGLTWSQSSQLRNANYNCRQTALFKSSFFQQPIAATHTTCWLMLCPFLHRKETHRKSLEEIKHLLCHL